MTMSLLRQRHRHYSKTIVHSVAALRPIASSASPSVRPRCSQTWIRLQLPSTGVDDRECRSGVLARSARPRKNGDVSTWCPDRHHRDAAVSSQLRWRSSSTQHHRARGGRGPDMRHCRSIPEIAGMAHDHLESMRPRDISAFWTLVSRLLATGGSHCDLDRGKQDAEQLQCLVRHLNSVFVRTMDEISTYTPREVAQVALGIARIVNIVGRDDRGRDGTSHPVDGQHQVLRGILVGRNSQRQGGSIFQSIANISSPNLHKFDAQCLCNLAYATAIVGSIPEFDDGGTLFDLIAENGIRRLGEFKAQELASMVWSFEKVGHIHPGLFEGVARHIVALGDVREFKPREIANILLTFAKTGYGRRNASLFNKLADHVVGLPNLETFNSQDLSNTVWAFGKADLSHPDLFGKVAARVIASLPGSNSFMPHHLSMIVWAYATAEASNQRLFQTIAVHITSLGTLSNYKPQELSCIISAYAKAGESHPKLFKKVADHIITADNLLRFKPQELSNILLAFTKAGESNPNLFKMVANHIISLESLMEFNSQALSNTLWACAKSKETNPILFATIADHIVALNDMMEFTPQALSNLLWSFAKIEESNPMLFNKVADHIIALDSLDGFKPQDLSNIVWAFAKEGSSNHRVFDKVAAHIIELDNMREFTPQTLSNTMWAYARAKNCHPVLFGKLADEAASRCGEFSSQEIANVLWSYASLGILDITLFSLLERAVADCVGNCNSQELANIAWAYAVANIDAPHLFHHESSFVNACIQQKDNFSVEDLSQLHQWRLWQIELMSSVSLPSSLEQKCHNAFILTRSHPSALQNDVIFELSAIGLDPQEEILTEIGYRLDALVEVQGTKFGIEVDGPFHFLGSRNLTGSTMLKRRQVTALAGMPLVFIPYWEWNKHGNNSYKKRQYLRALLRLDTCN